MSEAFTEINPEMAIPDEAPECRISGFKIKKGGRNRHVPAALKQVRRKRRQVSWRILPV